jgi:DMSO reductase anchor subunit
MNPAPSIILFTTASGAGYGLLFWLALLRPVAMTPQGTWFGFVALMTAVLLITLGLVSSTFHLGRPERAWRALSQWRSSWLSREGVAAVATFPPAALMGIAILADWGGLAAQFGVLAAIGAAGTVWCTGMIYASLKPIRQWHHPLVAPGYMLLAAFTGALLLAMLSAFWRGEDPAALLAAACGLAALTLKRRYWQAIDAPAPATSPSIESATGLGHIGRTRPLDPPHTEQTWLLREMVFRVARKHRERLRWIAFAGLALPVPLAVLAPFIGPAQSVGVLLAAVLVGAVGVAVERWLVFAEATHTVSLFYTGE